MSAPVVPTSRGAEAPRADSGHRPGLVLSLALLVVTLSYAGALNGPFVFDDRMLIVDNPLIQQRMPVQAHFTHAFWSTAMGMRSQGFYRPLVTLSYALDHRLWGDAPFGFHVTNLTVHLICCALVFAWARRCGAGALAAAVATALFGTLPRLTESVSWISGRTDLFAACFSIAALLVYTPAPGRWGRRTASAALVLLGLLAKEVAMTTAAALVLLELIDRTRTRRTWASSTRHLAPLLATLGCYAYLRLVLNAAELNDVAPAWTPRHLLYGAQALGTYAMMFLDPLRPRLQIGVLGVIETWPVVVGLVTAVGVIAAAVHVHRSQWPALTKTTAVMVVAPLLLVLHALHPLSLGVIAADRFLYLPCAALAALAAGRSGPLARARRLGRAAPRRGVTLALTAAAVLACASGTVVRNQAWADELELWNRTVSTSHPENLIPWLWRGAVYMERGDARQALADMEHGMSIWRRRSIEPPPPYLWHSVALCLDLVGRHDEAVALMSRLIQAEPGTARFRRNLVRMHLKALNFGPAETEARAAVAAAPGEQANGQLLRDVTSLAEVWRTLPPESADESAQVHARRAALMQQLGRADDAARLWTQIIDASDAPEDAVENAALYFTMTGDKERAGRARARLRALQDALRRPL